MELLNRYETRYGREYLRALACFNNQRTRKNAARQSLQISERTEPSRSELNPSAPHNAKGYR
jgi:hypothetical protein